MGSGRNFAMFHYKIGGGGLPCKGIADMKYCNNCNVLWQWGGKAILNGVDKK